MALAALAIPSQMQTYPSPFDAMLQLTASETITATAWMGAVTTIGTIDLGGGNPVSAVGRTEGIFNVLVSAAVVNDADENYRFFLFGSQDVAFGNGNVELLALMEVSAGVAGRVVATILGISPAIPVTNRAGTLLQRPFSNLSQGILYRYVRGYVVIGGTTPSVTYQSWLSKADIDV